MRKLLLVLLLTNLAAAQKLQVTTATAKRVALSWDGSAASWTIERKSGSGTFQKIASANATTYEDTTIAADGTYTYRVRGGDAATASNEVTVGPPPSGLVKAAPLPAGAVPDHYGVFSAMALDENGDPAIAFVWLDPNKDNDNADSELRFARWDRAKYRFSPATKIAVVGELDHCCEPVSLAADPATGVLALAYPVAGTSGFTVAFSDDRGATWKPAQVAMGEDDLASSTAMSWRAGHLQIVVNSDHAGPVFIDTEGTDAAKWKRIPAPKAGREHRGKTPVALAYDSADKPLVAFYDHAQSEEDNYVYAVWRPGDSESHMAVDTQKHWADMPRVALAFGGNRFGMLVAASMQENNDTFGVWYSGSSDGAAWSKPVKLPIDGPRSSGPPFDLAIDSKGRISAAFNSNSGSGSAPCLYPELSTSADGTTWKTCGIGKTYGLGNDPDQMSLHMLNGAGDKLFMLWPVVSANKNGQGMMLWHQP
jgi:hypothetical protein